MMMTMDYLQKKVLRSDKSVLQALAQDKEGLMKLKKSVKDIQQSGTSELSSSYHHHTPPPAV